MCVWNVTPSLLIAIKEQKHKFQQAFQSSQTALKLHHNTTDPRWRPGSFCSCCCLSAWVSHFTLFAITVGGFYFVVVSGESLLRTAEVNFYNTHVFFFLLSKNRILPIFYTAILIKNCNCVHKNCKNCNHMQQGGTVAQLRSMLTREFACSRRVGVGFLRVLRFSPQSIDMQVRWIRDIKLPIGVCVCVCVCWPCDGLAIRPGCLKCAGIDSHIPNIPMGNLDPT